MWRDSWLVLLIVTDCWCVDLPDCPWLLVLLMGWKPGREWWWHQPAIRTRSHGNQRAGCESERLPSKAGSETQADTTHHETDTRTSLTRTSLTRTQDWGDPAVTISLSASSLWWLQVSQGPAAIWLIHKTGGEEDWLPPAISPYYWVCRQYTPTLYTIVGMMTSGQWTVPDNYITGHSSSLGLLTVE